MLISAKPFLYWYKTDCYIEGEKIKEKDYHNRIAYSIKDDSPLLQDFIKIDISKNEDIIHFVNNYGFLKQDYPFSLDKKTLMGEKWHTVNVYSEDINYFKKQVLIFKSLRILHEAYTSDKPVDVLLKKTNAIQWPLHIMHELIEKTKKYLDITIKSLVIKNIEIKKQKYFEGTEYNTLTLYSEKVLKSDVINIFINLFNEQIKNICPVLSPNDDFNDINSHLKVNSLLEALYIKYYETIANGKELRLCANEKCTRDKYFPAIIGREKKYCSPECAVQGMQNKNYWETRNPDSCKYSPGKIEFDKKYRRLYYLLWQHNTIDEDKFNEWNKKARDKLKYVKTGEMNDKDFLDWLKNYKEECFLKSNN